MTIHHTAVSVICLLLTNSSSKSSYLCGGGSQKTFIYLSTSFPYNLPPSFIYRKSATQEHCISRLVKFLACARITLRLSHTHWTPSTAPPVTHMSYSSPLPFISLGFLFLFFWFSNFASLFSAFISSLPSPCSPCRPISLFGKAWTDCFVCFIFPFKEYNVICYKHYTIMCGEKD